jgi:hypothetical protein
LAPRPGLERETSGVHAVGNGGADDEILEYGRQIDLPERIPPPSKPAAEPRRPAGQPIAAAAPPTVSPGAPRGAAGDPGGLRVPSLTSDIVEQPDGSPATVVVPVAVPAAGKTTEIVVRIVVTGVK